MRKIMMAALMSAALMTPALAMAADAPAAATRVEKIAVVDAQALITKSKAGKSIQSQIERQRDLYRGQLSKIEKELMEDGKKLQDDVSNKNTADFAAKNKAFEAKKASYQKQAQEKGQSLEKGAGEALLKIRTSIASAVKGIAAKDHYTLILTRDNVVLAEEGMDITDKVMAELDKELPDVKLTLPSAKDAAPAPRLLLRNRPRNNDIEEWQTPRFFSRLGPITLGQIASLTGVEIQRGPADFKVYDVAALDKAEFEHLSFFDNVKYRDQFKVSRAGACFIDPMHVNDAPAGMSLLVTKTPYKAFAQASQLLYPDVWGDPKIADTARIHPDAKIGKGCLIEDYVVIGEGAEIGEGSWVEPHAVIGRHVTIGTKCRVGPHSSLSHCIVGSHTRFYPGTRIGQDGFGFAIDPANGHVKVPQLGRVLIGDHVEVGANTCIDRGSGPDTEISDGVWIDNLVQIAHNVKIGRGAIIVSQVGISGSTEIGPYAVLAGQAGIAGHLKIGKGARIAAKSGILRDIEDGAEVMGYPGLPLRMFMRQVAMLNQMSAKKGGDKS